MTMITKQLDEDEIYQLIGCLIILLTKEEYELLKEIIYGNRKEY